MSVTNKETLKTAGPEKTAIAERDGTAECGDRLADLVFRSPSIFGRLWAIAELRNEATGHYSHALAGEFGPAAVDGALRSLHREAFTSWLTLNLEQQERDVLIWLRWLGRNEKETAQVLSDIPRRQHQLIPAQHSEPERMLFLNDLSLALSLVRGSEGIRQRCWGAVHRRILATPRVRSYQA